MTLNENQRNMYKDCMFLNEGLFSKKEPIPEAYNTNVKSLQRTIKSKLESGNLISDVNLMGQYTGDILKVTLNYFAGTYMGTSDDEKLKNNSIKFIEKTLENLPNIDKNKTEKNQSSSNFYLKCGDFYIKILFFYSIAYFFKIYFKYIKNS